MPSPNPLVALVRRVNPCAADVPDAELLDRFVRSGDQAAFELLVWRHGTMVWGACRRILDPDRAAAEDACQASFVALVKHAARLRGRAALGAWLHRVAVRASIDLRRIATRRVPVEHLHVPVHNGDPSCQASDREVRSLLDSCLDRLPDKLRIPFVLCELEGRSNVEVAATLGCPVGTVESRLTRARHRLRGWLMARGVVPAVAIAAVTPPDSAMAAMASASNPTAPSAAVTALARRSIPATLLAKSRALVAVVLVMAMGAVGLGMALAQGEKGEDPPVPPKPKHEKLPMTQPAAGIGPGEVVDLLLVEAWAAPDGQITFVVPREVLQPDKMPPGPFITARVDGKDLRAVGVDGKPLDTTELVKRLPKWTVAVIIPADQGLPDDLYREVLAKRSVIFLVSKALFTPMAKAAGARKRSDGPRP